ncbi:MAG: OmpA family protein, partial [Geminicoccaceae bacterium]
MKPFRVKIVRGVAFFAGLGLIGVIMAERPMLAAGQADPLLRPTPLVLKDGRIANVSIHDVAFARGRAELTAEAGAELRELTRAIGTDCFLTAQVIGHIDSGEIAEQDSLSAHRLARSRADAVQASLIHGGLPAKAIASVWDWQFMVREARVTLWIFQLTAGEDCEGRPLREDLVAEVPQSQERRATPEPSQVVVPAVAPIESAPE